MTVMQAALIYVYCSVTSTEIFMLLWFSDKMTQITSVTEARSIIRTLVPPAAASMRHATNGLDRRIDEQVSQDRRANV